MGLRTPRDTVPLPSWQGDGALRALSVQYGPPWQEQLTPRGAGRLEAEPNPRRVCPASDGDSDGDMLAHASPFSWAYLGF